MERTRLEREHGYSFHRRSIPRDVQFAVLADGRHPWFIHHQLYRRALHRIMIGVSEWFDHRESLVALRQRALLESDE
jgi:hypothetical protein